VFWSKAEIALLSAEVSAGMKRFFSAHPIYTVTFHLIIRSSNN
jgi:hypothetical protein